MKVLSFLKISGEFFLDYERDLVDLVSIFCYNITTFVKEVVFFFEKILNLQLLFRSPIYSIQEPYRAPTVEVI